MEKRIGFAGFVKDKLRSGISAEVAYTSIYGFILGWVLFKNWIGVMFTGGMLLILAVMFPDNSYSHRVVLRQTADILEAMSSGLSSGNNPIKALTTACSQVQDMYISMGVQQIQAVETLRLGIGIGDTSGHSAFLKLGEDIESVEIRTFANSLRILEAKGGNMARLCAATCDILRRQCDLQEEVEAMRTDMDLSRRILFAIIPGVLILLQIMAPDFLTPMYGGTGRLLAIAVLLTIMISWILGRKLCQID